MEKQNLKQLFMAGGESAATAFELNKTLKLLDRYEIEKMSKSLIKNRLISGNLFFQIAKKYKLFPQYRRFKKRKGIYEYPERIRKINMIIQAETSRNPEFYIVDIGEFMGEPSDVLLKFCLKGVEKLAQRMHIRITTHQEEFEGGGYYLDGEHGFCEPSPIFEDWGYYPDDPQYKYTINFQYKDYIAGRKKYGYISEPISEIFR